MITSAYSHIIMLTLSSLLFLMRLTRMVYYLERPVRYEHFLLAFIYITILTFNSLRFLVRSNLMVYFCKMQRC